MKNTYEVLVTAFTTLIVEAEDETQALELASDEAGFLSGWDIEEYKVDNVLKDEESVKSAIRHSTYHTHDHRKTPYTE